jgi:hypothetical protein
MDMKRFIQYLHFFWGLMGIFAGIGFAFYIHPVLGKLDIISLAGVVLTVLFALIAGSNLKSYHDSLETAHRELTQRLRDELRVKEDEITNKIIEAGKQQREGIEAMYQQLMESNKRHQEIMDKNIQSAAWQIHKDLEARIRKLEKPSEDTPYDGTI